MILHTWQPDELYALMDDLCDGTLTDCSAARLNEILRDDLTARREYLAYLSIHADLGVNRVLGEGKAVIGPPIAVGQSSPSEILPSTFPVLPPSPIHQPLSASFPPLNLLSTAYHGTANFFSQEIPFACLMATLFMIVGGIIGSFITKEHYTQMPGRSMASAERSFADANAADRPVASTEQKKEIVFVGRITGMVDCRWAEPGRTFGSITDYSVALHDKYSLSSGLMEITYNTGAKVILQGPVTYEVESANGGYMSVGKLTGKVETEKAKGFAVRTPTVVVTDLGTEFGVEVDKSGVTESLVLRGSVSIQLVAANGQSLGQETILRENDSVRVETSSTGDNRPVLVVCREAAKADAFVRDMPKRTPPLPMQVLAYFRLGEDDPGATAGAPANERTINHDGKPPLEKHGSASYTAAVVPGSSLAMNFTGAEDEYFFTSNLGWSPDDNFILEAWVRPNRVADGQSCIVHNGRPGTEVNNPSILDGYGLFVYDRHYEYLFGGVNWSPPLAPCEPGEWTHLALVCQQRKVQFWLNGRLAYEAADPMWPIPSSGPFMIGGVPAGVSTMPRSFDGQIDEVRLSWFRGTFDPKMLLWRESPERRN